MFLSGEIKGLGTIICSLFCHFTCDLKEQISAKSFYTSAKLLANVPTIEKKRVVSVYFVSLCPEANKTPPEAGNPTVLTVAS